LPVDWLYEEQLAADDLILQPIETRRAAGEIGRDGLQRRF
jgi:hypothetical protein